ncbi:Na+/H+ antiporter subunit E [Streptomyces jumonjinensis]|uniref:Na+/H+ antiporter subunit E n=1 Tax=Streptomyces jumonjinensis TaxID=1945 RepID=A0A646K9F0_STRJU|nr:Na+/H+ antiporter subunit E [Streptomyces jumonjinensis]MQS98794.1 Na+/H+ antiporter subunit E [Streptomyces jumonjinensis]
MISLGFHDPDLPPYRCVVLGRRRILDLPLIAWLTVVWVLLWGNLSWANVLNGVLVAVVLCLVFPLPVVDLRLRLHPLGITRLAVCLLADMYSSGVKVARQMFDSRPYRAAVLAVPLRCRSDLMLTATAVAVSNVPDGSVVEVRRSNATLFVHILEADDPEAADRARRSVWRMEELIVRAFGDHEEIDRVRAAPRPGGGGR